MKNMIVCAIAAMVVLVLVASVHAAPPLAQAVRVEPVLAKSLPAKDVLKDVPVDTRDHPECKGDVNDDGLINFDDIDPFVWVLKHRMWQIHHPNHPKLWRADINNDGRVNQADVNPFVALIQGEEPICR